MSAEKSKKGVDILNPRIGPPPLDEVTRFEPVRFPVPREKYAELLQSYLDLALDMGVEDAKIVHGKDIPQDIRALYLCNFPRCRWLNTNLLCPDLRKIPWEEAREIVDSYEYAIVYKVLPPSDKVVAEADIGPVKLGTHYIMGGGEAPDEALLKREVIRLRILGEMSRRLQQAAYYSGYLLAMPISAGPCIATWCSDSGKCVGTDAGGFCKYPIITSPVGQAAFYLDFNGLGRMLGWGEMQPGGNCAFMMDVPDFKGYYNIGINFVI